MATLWRVLTRKKILHTDTDEQTPLARVLNTFDLTALGVGSTLGVGVYVLAGQVARNTAGPAVIISFLIAAIASVFAGLCYAEFGARTPKAGSAYIYSYVCVGEFIAFVIGWNLILEYIIGSASVAKGLSSYVDNLCNGSLSNTFRELVPLDVPYLSGYFDVFAFSVPIILSIALAFGMKESSLLNNIFTTCNIGVVLFVIVAGAMNAHWSNWNINPNDVKNVSNTTNLGHGGFFPFGIQGVIKGAATCFYGFVGFDCIATTGEEVKNPKRAIPIAIIFSLLIIFLAYFGTSTVLTLMVPYYEQNPDAPIPFAFQAIHWYTAAYIVTFGAMFGLYASLFGAMFPLPRILYAMATDGLIFKFLGKVNERFKTPVVGTLLAGVFTGSMAAIFELGSLVNMMSIGTLLAYTIVAACVLLLRYSEDEKGYTPIPGSSDSEEDKYAEDHHNTENINDNEESALTDTTEVNTCVMKQIFNFKKNQVPSRITQMIVTVDICLFCVLSLLLGLCALYLNDGIVNQEVIPLSLVTVIFILMALTMVSIASQPVSRTILSFQVPWVPLIPALSIFCNIYLMIMLDIATWIRFAVWMIIGVLIFHFTRRRSPNVDKTVTPDEGYVNNGFYDDNIVYSKGSDANQENLVATEEKMFPPLKIVEDSNESIIVQTPSPSRVIESLDLVIDSFVDDSITSYVTSASEVPSALVFSNKLLGSDFRDTPNSALRSELLNRMKDYNDLQSEEEVSNQIRECSSEGLGLEGDIDLIGEMKKEDSSDSNDCEKDNAESRTEQSSSTCSETSYESAASTIDTGQNKISDMNEATDTECITTPPSLIPPPPPPPPIEDFTHFISRKINPEPTSSNSQKNESLTLERLKAKNRESPMIINKNSLNSVKLRHVHRPSIERSHSENKESDQTRTNDIELKTVTPINLDKADKDSQTSVGTFFPKINLKHVESSGNKSESQNDSEIPKPGRYFKSKSVNELEKRSNIFKNENSSNTLNKMGISKDAINSVKLRPVVRPTLNINKETQSDLPDSVKFGTSEFEEFKGKLNEKLKKPVKILREPSFVDPKTTPKNPEVKVNRENVIDDNLDLSRARVTIENEIGNKLSILKKMQEAEESAQTMNSSDNNSIDNLNLKELDQKN